ncbi:MAG: adenosine deaminase [Oligoflexia bacterium]
MRQIELHRHLDVSLRLSTLHELAVERGLIGQSTSLDAFAKDIVIRKPMTDLNSVLASFSICQQVLDRFEVLERVAFEACQDVMDEGTTQVELRFSPSFVGQLSKISWDEQLDAFEAGIARYGKTPAAAQNRFKAGLICIISRDFGVDTAQKVVDFFLKNQDRFLGIDLAGPEADFENRLFEAPFKRLRRENPAAHITIHAGESQGPDSIWSAIEDLGAQRIGHGIAAIQDPQLLQVLCERDICLEVCPTSNWLTRVVPSLNEHPLPRLLRAGVPVCINTDDPTLFGNTLASEIRICKEILGLTNQEIATCFDHARRAQFF